MHLHLNPLGGLAGDMFCAALLDMHPELLTHVQETVALLEMPVPVQLALRDSDGIIKGSRFQVSPKHPPSPHHTRWKDIHALLDRAPLPAPVRQRAIKSTTALPPQAIELGGSADADSWRWKLAQR